MTGGLVSVVGISTSIAAQPTATPSPPAATPSSTHKAPRPAHQQAPISAHQKQSLSGSTWLARQPERPLGRPGVTYCADPTPAALHGPQGCYSAVCTGYATSVGNRG
jgi:hypothetical protein